MKKNIITGLSSAVAVLACASSIYATPTDAIRYSTDGGTSWTEIDDLGGTGVIHTSIDTVNASGVGFLLDVVASKTKPTIGTAASPQMDLAISGIAGGNASIMIEFSADEFTPIPTGAYITRIAPNNDATVTETEVTRIGSDSLFASGTTLGTLGPESFGVMVGSGKPASQSDPYSITLSDVFASSGADLVNVGTRDLPIWTQGASISTDDHLRVPDGGNTLMLLGSALSVLGLGVFRNSRKAVKA